MKTSAESIRSHRFIRRLLSNGLAVAAITIAAVEYSPATMGRPDPLPSPATYKVDSDHSFVYFSAWHHVVGVVRGRFDRVTGTITAASNPAECAVDIAIDTASISTQNGERDDDLRGPDFFDVKHYPTATYRGRGIHRSGNAWIIDGTLTIRGVSKVVPLTFTFRGLLLNFVSPPGKSSPAAFHGTAATRRGDFGMTRDNAIELGVPPALGADVQLEIDVEANQTRPLR